MCVTAGSEIRKMSTFVRYSSPGVHLFRSYILRVSDQAQSGGSEATGAPCTAAPKPLSINVTD